MSELTGLPPITPDSSKWFAQMAALPIPRCDLDALKCRLYDAFHIEILTVVWNGRQFVRISIQGFNTQEDVDTLAGALELVLPQVLRE